MRKLSAVVGAAAMILALVLAGGCGGDTPQGQPGGEKAAQKQPSKAGPKDIVGYASNREGPLKDKKTILKAFDLAAGTAVMEIDGKDTPMVIDTSPEQAKYLEGGPELIGQEVNFVYKILPDGTYQLRQIKGVQKGKGPGEGGGEPPIPGITRVDGVLRAVDTENSAVKVEVDGKEQTFFYNRMTKFTVAGKAADEKTLKIGEPVRMLTVKFGDELTVLHEAHQGESDLPLPLAQGGGEGEPGKESIRGKMITWDAPAQAVHVEVEGSGMVIPMGEDAKIIDETGKLIDPVADPDGVELLAGKQVVVECYVGDDGQRYFHVLRAAEGGGIPGEPPPGAEGAAEPQPGTKEVKGTLRLVNVDESFLEIELDGGALQTIYYNRMSRFYVDGEQVPPEKLVVGKPVTIMAIEFSEDLTVAHIAKQFTTS